MAERITLTFGTYSRSVDVQHRLGGDDAKLGKFIMFLDM
jgi:hypothetical protein